MRAAHSGVVLPAPAPASCVEAERVARDVVAVDQALGDQHVHHAERERAVGAGQQRDVLRAFLRRQAAVRIDRDHLGAAALRLLHARPQVQVGDDRVGAPEQDQLRLVEALRVHADRAAERRLEAELAGRGAQRAVEQRGAEPVEEAPVHRSVLHHAHGAGVAAAAGWSAGSSAASALRRAAISSSASSQEMRSNSPLPFGADALHADAAARSGAVGALEVVRDLGAQRAVGERHRRIALDLHRDAVLHGDQHAAGVGAVVRAGGAHDLDGGSAFSASCARGVHAGNANPRVRAARSSGAPARALRPAGASRQPMLAVAIAAGAPPLERRELARCAAAARARAAGSSRCPPSRSTGARPRPASARSPACASSASTSPRICWPCCSEQGDWNATRPAVAARGRQRFARRRPRSKSLVSAEMRAALSR